MFFLTSLLTVVGVFVNKGNERLKGTITTVLDWGLVLASWEQIYGREALDRNRWVVVCGSIQFGYHNVFVVRVVLTHLVVDRNQGLAVS